MLTVFAAFSSLCLHQATQSEAAPLLSQNQPVATRHIDGVNEATASADNDEAAVNGEEAEAEQDTQEEEESGPALRDLLAALTQARPHIISCLNFVFNLCPFLYVVGTN